MRIFLLSVLALVLVSGCKASNDAPAVVAEELGVEAPNALEAAAGEVANAVPRTGVKAELGIIRGQVKTYQRVEGSWPASLDAVDSIGRLQYPDEYSYDAATGEVKSTTYPEL